MIPPATSAAQGLAELVANLARTQSRLGHRLYVALARTAFLQKAVRHLRYRFARTP
jgi:hypothetical protein